jgi:prepilin-type N-terminal cleavage/methylation domain-containing protein
LAKGNDRGRDRTHHEPAFRQFTGREQRKAKTMKTNIRNQCSGFTLVEIMIVVAIIGLLAAIAIPNFVKARTSAQQKACIANLSTIGGSVEQWAVEYKKAAADTYALTDATLLAFLRGSVLPACPGGGAYTAGATVSNNPTCNISGHTI